MLAIVLSMLALGQGAGETAPCPDDAPQSVDFLSKPPIQIRKAPSCQCPETPEDGVLIIEGLVVDAEVTLAPGGLSVNDRQATIFNILTASEDGLKGRTKIWHSSNLAQCGVTFNYGAKYKLIVRRLKDDDEDSAKQGVLETDACLMRQSAAGG
jgi:hypothetical protein